MKAEDMPTPETDALAHNIAHLGYDEQAEQLADLSSRLEQRLAVQTALAQSLRATVERAVELLDQVKDHYNKCPPCKNSVSAFLAEIGARSAEAIQERGG